MAVADRAPRAPGQDGPGSVNKLGDHRQRESRPNTIRDWVVATTTERIVMPVEENEAQARGSQRSVAFVRSPFVCSFARLPIYVIVYLT